MLSKIKNFLHLLLKFPMRRNQLNYEINMVINDCMFNYQNVSSMFALMRYRRHKQKRFYTSN